MTHNPLEPGLHKAPSDATPNGQVQREACEWFVEFRVGDPGARARTRFNAWLKASPAHLAAYLDTVATWNQGASPKLLERWSKEQLIEEARRLPEVVIAYPASSETAAATTRA